MRQPLRLLLVVSRFPLPARKGDQRRTLQAIDALASEHRLTVLAPEPPNGISALSAHDRRRIDSLPVEWVHYRPAGWLGRVRATARAVVSGMPLQCGLFASPDLGPALARLAHEADLAIVQTVRLAPWLGHLEGRPVMADLIDSLALSTARRSELDHVWLDPPLRLEARRLERWEGRLAVRAARTLVVSERDRLAVERAAPQAAGRVRVLPVAVSGDTEDPAAGGPAPGNAPPAGGQAARSLAVTGNLGYFPTSEGLRWLLDAVWPWLRSEEPDLRLVLAGTRVPGWLRRRVRRTAGVELVSDPPDLGRILRRATVALAPMRAGAGQPLKVGDAWSAGVPVVATPWAAAGTTGRPGEELIVADGAAEWVTAIRSLLDDPARARSIAAAALRRVEADYSPRSVREGWLGVVEEAVLEAREALEARSRP